MTIAVICVNRGIDILFRGAIRAFATAVVQLFVINGCTWRHCLRQSLIKQSEVCRAIPLCCRRLRNLCRSVIIRTVCAFWFKCTRVLYDVHSSRCSHTHKGHILWHQRAFRSRPLRRNSPTVTHILVYVIDLCCSAFKTFRIIHLCVSADAISCRIHSRYIAVECRRRVI